MFVLQMTADTQMDTSTVVLQMTADRVAVLEKQLLQLDNA